MEVREMRDDDKKVLENLAVEFGEDFLNNFNGETIGLYGINDCEILDFFQDKLGTYLSERGSDVKIMQNSLDGYRINVGFFLNGSGYYKGLNKDIEGYCN